MSQAHEVMLNRVSRLGKLFDEDRDAIRALPIEEADLGAQENIAREHDKPSHSLLVVSGFAATFKETVEGKRQIHYFHRAGDMPDLYSLHLTTLDASLGTVPLAKWDSSATIICGVFVRNTTGSQQPFGAARLSTHQ